MRVDQGVIQVLSEGTIEGLEFRLPDRQLDRKTYEAVNKVLEAAGGKWNRKAKAHLFAGDAAEALDQIILTGEVTNKKQEFGFFETPADIVEMVIEAAEIQPGDRVLEPSAGHGAIAKAAVAAGAKVYCVEVQPENVAVLQAVQPAFDFVLHKDFLLHPVAAPVYDKVVMNPPFAKRADILHVTHALKFLKPGGKLVAIMPASVSFRSDRLAVAFRELVAAHGGSIEPLPEGSFKSSGTGVSTVLVTMVKEVR